MQVWICLVDELVVWGRGARDTGRLSPGAATKEGKAVTGAVLRTADYLKL